MKTDVENKGADALASKDLLSGNVHFSSKTNEWETPQAFFDKLNAEFHFTLDPCCTHENAKCAKHYTQTEDGLAQDWSKDVVFMNPPYGKEIFRWMQKAYAEWCRGATIVCLVPARTDTKWFQSFAMEANEIRWVKGRLKFGGHKNSAPFPSAVVIFRPLNDKSSHTAGRKE